MKAVSSINASGSRSRIGDLLSAGATVSERIRSSLTISRRSSSASAGGAVSRRASSAEENQGSDETLLALRSSLCRSLSQQELPTRARLGQGQQHGVDGSVSSSRSSRLRGRSSCDHLVPGSCICEYIASFTSKLRYGADPSRKCGLMAASTPPLMLLWNRKVVVDNQGRPCLQI